MAEVVPLTVRISKRNSLRTVWASLTAADAVGNAENSISEFADKTVQFSGTFDGATAVMQGTNDGATWVTLHDLQGNDISFTAPGIAVILENPAGIRPSTSGGGGSQDIDVAVCSRR